MPDTLHYLRPATPDQIADTLSFALRCQGRKVHHADDAMAGIAAERLSDLYSTWRRRASS
jgi:hypothetical protein